VPVRLIPLSVALLLALVVSDLAHAQRAGRYRAAIDMGSSSIKMVVTDSRGRVVRDVKVGASLGRGIGPDRLLPRANQERAVAGLKGFIAAARRYGIEPGEIDVITTAAVRNANGRVTRAARDQGKATGRQFIERQVRGDLGLVRARILTGRQEALLGYKGALAGIDAGSTARFVVVDTGGGSHQVIAGTRSAILEAGSTQIGSNYVAEKVLVDSRGRRLDVLGPRDLARADRRLARAVPSLPISSESARGGEPVAIGGVSKFLRAYFRKDQVSRQELEALHIEVGALPAARRLALVSRDASGKPFTRLERSMLGLAAPKGEGDYGDKLPAKLTLLLRLMEILDEPTLRLSPTDARHALVR
jgi:exopolyphosphatase / guanosine-5'-triphosphate,3'-diphosphate pyrophosphatase